MKTSIKLILAAFVVLWLGAIAYYVVGRNKSKPPGGNTTTVDIRPPAEAITAVTDYLQARENAVGSDQSSPAAWLASVKPITTPNWFAQLQPNPDAPTATSSNDYRVAHDSGYVVKATVSNCTWDDKTKPTTDSGSLHCELTDTTLRRTDNSEVPSGELPFGWAHTGSQPAPGLKMVKQNGAWLIDGDITGQDV